MSHRKLAGRRLPREVMSVRFVTGCSPWSQVDILDFISVRGRKGTNLLSPRLWSKDVNPIANMGAARCTIAKRFLQDVGGQGRRRKVECKSGRWDGTWLGHGMWVVGK